MDDVEFHDQLLAAETALAMRDRSSVAGSLGALIAEDFVEFGASGATRDAATVRAIIDSDPGGGETVELADFVVDRLSDDVALVTYRLGPPRPTNRSSVWVRHGGSWLVRFHQATPRDA